MRSFFFGLSGFGFAKIFFLPFRSACVVGLLFTLLFSFLT